MKLDETKLTAYALDELPQDERAIVDTQIANDAAARKQVDEIRRSARLIETALKTEVLPQPSRTIRRGRDWRIVLAVAASVLLVGGIAFQVLRPSLNRAREFAASQQNLRQEMRSIPSPALVTPSQPAVAPPAVPVPAQVIAPPDTFAPAITPAPLAAPAAAATPQDPGLKLGDKSSLELSGLAPGATPQAAVAEAMSPAPIQVARSDVLSAVSAFSTSSANSEGAVLGEVRGGRAFAPRDGFNTETYDRITDNAFLDVVGSPLSTFSIDVDTASYSNTRRFLTQGRLPPPDAVRIEELINYFPYDYKHATESKGPFTASVEIAECPWNSSHRLARVGIKAKEIATNERPASNLVFLLDVSGSMNSPNKLPLVKSAMGMLVEKLTPRDRVTIVVYAGNSGLVLPPTSGSDKQKILAAIDELRPGGSTNGAGGITLAYEQAQSSFIEGGVNRVILATDGDFNVGVTDQGQLTRLIEDKAKSGVFLSVLGFGMGNLKDSTMEKLADKGNGNYAYIDTRNEARKVLVEQMSGTLVTVAKDVKIQVEFNPSVASSYRLIGYENRMLAKEDFNDDKKDAGEIGAGHTVTALYEIVPQGEKFATPRVDELKYQNSEKNAKSPSGELMTLKLRYKEPDGEKSKLMEIPVSDGGASFAKSSDDFKFTAAVAGFGMLLRNSPHKGSTSFGGVLEWAGEGVGEDENGYRKEFLELVKRAETAKGN